MFTILGNHTHASGKACILGFDKCRRGQMSYSSRASYSCKRGSLWPSSRPPRGAGWNCMTHYSFSVRGLEYRIHTACWYSNRKQWGSRTRVGENMPWYDPPTPIHSASTLCRTLRTSSQGYWRWFHPANADTDILLSKFQNYLIRL